MIEDKYEILMILKKQHKELGKLEGKIELIEKMMQDFNKNQKVLEYLICELKNIYCEKFIKFGWDEKEKNNQEEET